MTSTEPSSGHAARRRAIAGLCLGAPLLAAGCASRGATQEEPEPPVEFPLEWFADSAELNLNASLEDIRLRLPEFGRCRVLKRLDLRKVPGKVSVAFKDNDRLTALVARDLSERGLNVAAPGEQAATLTIDVAVGFYGVFGAIPPVPFGAFYEAAVLDGMQAATRAWVTATAFGGQPGVAATRIAVGEVAGRLLGVSGLLRLASGVGDLLSASGRRQRANYLAYGNVHGRCIFDCDRPRVFTHHAAGLAFLKSDEGQTMAWVQANPRAKQMDPYAAFALTYGLLVRDGLQLGAERWIDQLVDPKPVQAPQEEPR